MTRTHCLRLGCSLLPTFENCEHIIEGNVGADQRNQQVIEDVCCLFCGPFLVDRIGLELEADLERLFHDLALIERWVGEEPSGVGLVGGRRPAASKLRFKIMENHASEPNGAAVASGSAAADWYVRPVIGFRTGFVTGYDSDAGIGSVASGGEAWRFHCTTITDGSRHIEAGTFVRFEVRAGGPGRWEAFDVAAIGQSNG